MPFDRLGRSVVPIAVATVLAFGVLSAPFGPDHVLREGFAWAILLGAVAAVLGPWRHRDWRERLAILLGGWLTADIVWSRPTPFELSVVIIASAFIWAIVAYQRHRPVAEYLLLGRFPLMAATVFLLLGPLMLWAQPKYLRNLLEVHWPGMIVVAAQAGLLAQAIVFTLDLIVRHGSRRAGVDPWPGLAAASSALVRTPWSNLMALPLLAFVVARSDDPIPSMVTAALVGLAIAELIVRAGRQVGNHLEQAIAAAEAPSPSPRSARERVTRGVKVCDIKARELVQQAQKVSGQRLRSHPHLSSGYVDEEKGELLPDHLAVILVALATGAVYAAGYLAFGPWNVGVLPDLIDPPALAYVLVLLMLLTWLLSAASFFLDRFRVPTLLVAAAVPFILYFVHDLDHYYSLDALAPGTVSAAPAVDLAAQPRQADAATVAEAEKREIRDTFNRRYPYARDKYGDRPPIVIVSASGGGISAGLWTATVLAGLKEEFGPRFADSIHLISAVSGGSVGAMHFVNGFQANGTVPDTRTVLDRAGRSSLSAVAWGFAYPDFWRAFSLHLPWRKEIDRGWAMERVWQRTLGQESPTLRTWHNDVRAGWRPALAFNATIVETGERLVMSSLGLSPVPPACEGAVRRGQEEPNDCDNGLRARTNLSLYPQHDLSVVRAARLSSAFPFVSPIAKAMPESVGLDYHVADGGYYDNFGVVTTVEWLRKLVRLNPREKPEKPRVLFIQIRQSDYHATSEAPPRRRAGWMYAVSGPLNTMMSARESSQATRNDLEVALLRDWMTLKGWEFDTTVFLLPSLSPTSWHLSHQECEEILQAWDVGGHAQGSDLVAARKVVGKFFTPVSTPVALKPLPVCSG